MRLAGSNYYRFTSRLGLSTEDRCREHFLALFSRLIQRLKRKSEWNVSVT